ncbi:hypothetical protein LTR08_004756 [Meristemomyces frigidus]|nr:hypothetical protein LTR08_004756 [Meristemomyces frigidus]
MSTCCASGSLHTGTPTGRISKLHGLDCYIADAPNGQQSKGMIIIISDAFGWKLPNNRILADQYAKRVNAQVLLPDCMGGNDLPEDLMSSMKAMGATGFWNQFSKIGHAVYLMRCMIPFLYFLVWCRPTVAGPKIYGFIKAIRDNEAKDKTVGAAGFCWGGKFVTELCWDEMKTESGKRLIDCGFIAHPSFLKVPEDIEKVVLPLSVAAAEHDHHQMKTEKANQTKETLVAKTAKTKDDGIEHEFVMYDGVPHGFAVRADENEKHEAAQGQKAEDQAVEWFSRWLAKPPPTPDS